MLPSYLRHLSDMRIEVAATEAKSVFTAGMPAKLNSSHAGGKDLRCFLLPSALCPHMPERYRRQCRRLDIAGTSVAYENQALSALVSIQLSSHHGTPTVCLSTGCYPCKYALLEYR